MKKGREELERKLDQTIIFIERLVREALALECLDPTVGNFGRIVPKGAWHTVEVLEPSVILEAKEGRYGEDGTESFS